MVSVMGSMEATLLLKLSMSLDVNLGLKCKLNLIVNKSNINVEISKECVFGRFYICVLRLKMRTLYFFLYFAISYCNCLT